MSSKKSNLWQFYANICLILYSNFPLKFGLKFICPGRDTPTAVGQGYWRHPLRGVDLAVGIAEPIDHAIVCQ